jgi:hypothetical protein
MRSSRTGTPRENVAMVSDLAIGLLMLVYAVSQW